MHRPPLIVRLVVLTIVVVIVFGAAWYDFQQSNDDTGALAASGTIEARSVVIAPQAPGRVVAVNATEGQAVDSGQALVVLDGAVMAAQRDQVEAQLRAAEAAAVAASAAVDSANENVASAQAHLALLEAGPSDEQVAVAQANVDAAQAAVSNLDDAYNELSNAAEDTPAGRELKLRRDTARAGLETAQAQLALVESGARPEELDAARAQLDAASAQASAAAGQASAATAQVDAARANLALVDSQIAQLTLAAPIEGVVLTRAIEPGEFAGAGAALLVLGDLADMTITVYVPEDRYGELSLGQTATITADSFPGATFNGEVVHIADQAEFTPRNVQTPEGRKSTVFAIEVAVDDPDGLLKPGMPADVQF